MKTAVEWLLDILVTENEVTLKGENYKLFKQAKEMEKQQIIDCSIRTTQDVWISAMDALGEEIIFCDEDLEDQKQEAEQYYNETFKDKL